VYGVGVRSRDPGAGALVRRYSPAYVPKLQRLPSGSRTEKPRDP
jgi:hypothetical protein